jgi:hypothetical protein
MERSGSQETFVVVQEQVVGFSLSRALMAELQATHELAWVMTAVELQPQLSLAQMRVPRHLQLVEVATPLALMA